MISEILDSFSMVRVSYFSSFAKNTLTTPMTAFEELQRGKYKNWAFLDFCVSLRERVLNLTDNGTSTPLL